MSHCWCKQAGLDDGAHIFEHCKYDDNGKLKPAKVAAAASVTSNADEMAALAFAIKKFQDSQPADATSETHHAKSAVVTPPEDIEQGLMTDDAMTEQLRQFYALSSEQQASWLGPLDAAAATKDSTSSLSEFLAALLSRK